MTMVGGGYNNEPGFNPLAALRERFKKRSQDRFELAKIEYEHSLGMQRAALDHQYAQERMLQEFDFKRGESSADRAFRASESQAQRDFDGNQALADRTSRLGESQSSKDHELTKMQLQAEIDTAAREQTAGHERKSQNNQGRISRANMRAAQRSAETLPPGAQASGGGMSASSPKEPPKAPTASNSGNRKPPKAKAK